MTLLKVEYKAVQKRDRRRGLPRLRNGPHRQQYCKKGHDIDADHYKHKDGSRQCGQCARDRDAARVAAHKEKIRARQRELWRARKKEKANG